MSRTFQVGDFCTFKDRGVTREGKIVAAENVVARDRHGRREGRWLTIRLAGSLLEDAECHESQLGGILEVKK